MESFRQLGAGFLLGIIFLAIVLGGFALAKVEGSAVLEAATSETPAPPIAPVIPSQNPTQPAPIITSTPPTFLVTDTPAPTSTGAPTFTPPPPPVSCWPPAGWVAIVVQPYDTLNTLAYTYHTTTDALAQGNCLASSQLVAGSFLYVPFQASATALPCGAPVGWINYYVIPGDTLYRIGLLYRISVPDLQRANCLGNSDVIKTGQVLKVPNVATSIPSVIVTMAIPSATPTLTPTLPLPTDTPSATLAPTETSTLAPAAVTPENTPTP